MDLESDAAKLNTSGRLDLSWESIPKHRIKDFLISKGGIDVNKPITVHDQFTLGFVRTLQPRIIMANYLADKFGDMGEKLWNAGAETFKHYAFHDPKHSGGRVRQLEIIISIPSDQITPNIDNQEIKKMLRDGKLSIQNNFENRYYRPLDNFQFPDSRVRGN